MLAHLKSKKRLIQERNEARARNRHLGKTAYEWWEEYQNAMSLAVCDGHTSAHWYRRAGLMNSRARAVRRVLSDALRKVEEVIEDPS